MSRLDDQIRTPLGTWTVAVQLSSGEMAAELSFRADGTAALTAERGSSGVGTWESTGDGRFRYRIEERMSEVDGARSGWVDIDQHAEQDGAAFRSSGTSLVHDEHGTVVASAVVKTSAVRA
jgi:hypothetical protein